MSKIDSLLLGSSSVCGAAQQGQRRGSSRAPMLKKNLTSDPSGLPEVCVCSTKPASLEQALRTGTTTKQSTAESCMPTSTAWKPNFERGYEIGGRKKQRWGAAATRAKTVLEGSHSYQSRLEEKTCPWQGTCSAEEENTHLRTFYVLLLEKCQSNFLERIFFFFKAVLSAKWCKEWQNSFTLILRKRFLWDRSLLQKRKVFPEIRPGHQDLADVSPANWSVIVCRNGQ